MVKPIPEGYHSVTPYLILNAASDAIAFYKKALGAAEVMRMDDTRGKIHHAEISIGGSRLMLADEHPEIQALSPKTIGGSHVSIHLKLEAATFRRLVQHLRERTDVQNIDLMNLAGFCRNCLSKWYRAEAEDRGLALSDPESREIVYGMPYDEWRAKYQKEASAEQKAAFAAAQKH